jgi:hypothetical protein
MSPYESTGNGDGRGVFVGRAVVGGVGDAIADKVGAADGRSEAASVDATLGFTVGLGDTAGPELVQAGAIPTTSETKNKRCSRRPAAIMGCSRYV